MTTQRTLPIARQMWLLKCRKAGEKRFRFVGADGRLEWLRVHAMQYRDEVIGDVLARMTANNPDEEFMAVKAN